MDVPLIITGNKYLRSYVLCHWSCIDEIVIGFMSLEELYPSPPLGVDSADTSQLAKEKNLHGQIQYFQITRQ